MNNTAKKQSPLVEAVLKLDDYLSELQRLGAKIESFDIQKDFDFEQIQKFMARFAECGEGVSTEVVNLSTALNAARAEAEKSAAVVSARAEEMQTRRDEQQQKMVAFSQLGEKVRDLTQSLSESKDPGAVAARLPSLIEEARALKNDAQKSKMKVLEQSADSLTQSLVAISKKLVIFEPTTTQH